MKAGACFLIYELIFNRLIFVFMHKSEFFKKYFMGSIFIKKEEPKPEEEKIEEENEHKKTEI